MTRRERAQWREEYRGVCMCGSPMAGHSHMDGHFAVSMGEYYYPEPLTLYRHGARPLARWWTRRKRAWVAAGFSRWIGW